MKHIIITILLAVSTLTIHSQVYQRPTNQLTPPIIKKTVSTRISNARTFTATAYCLSGKMANGERVHSGAVAADPRILPLGTKIQIWGMGVYTVKDTGGMIKGNRLDLWLKSCQAARAFGRRSVQIIPM